MGYVCLLQCCRAVWVAALGKEPLKKILTDQKLLTNNLVSMGPSFYFDVFRALTRFRPPGDTSICIPGSVQNLSSMTIPFLWIFVNFVQGCSPKKLGRLELSGMK